MSDWRWPQWDNDATNAASRVYVPEAGGWVYKYRYGDLFSHVFVPDLAIWAETVAEYIAKPKDTAVSIFSNLSAAQDIKQPIPSR